MSDRTIQFSNCLWGWNDAGSYSQVEFNDGATLTALPNMSETDIARARALGYEGTDYDCVVGMTRDHDLLHCILAEAEGMPHSVALWSAAHPDVHAPAMVKIMSNREERVVLLMQRMQNVGIEGLIAP